MTDLLNHRVEAVVGMLVDFLGDVLLCECDASVGRHGVCLRNFVVFVLHMAGCEMSS